MSKRILIFVIAALLAFSAAGCATIKQTPTDSPAATATPSPSPSLSPTPDATASPSPADSVSGAGNETGYVNDELGFSMAYPEGYTVLTSDEINTLMSQTIDYIKSQFTDPALAEQTISQSVPVAMAFKHPLTYADGFNANVNIMIMNVPGASSMKIIDIASASIEQAESQTQAITYGDPSAIEISGKSAVVVDESQTAAGFSVIQKQYFFACGDNVVALTIAADNDADLAELASMAEAIQFAQ